MGSLLISSLCKQQGSQFFINIATWTDKDNIDARLIVVDAKDNSIGSDAIGSEACEFKLKRMSIERRDKKLFDSLPDFVFDLRV